MTESTSHSSSDDSSDDTDTSYLGHTQVPDDSPESESDLALSEQAKRVQAQREQDDR